MEVIVIFVSQIYRSLCTRERRDFFFKILILGTVFLFTQATPLVAFGKEKVDVVYLKNGGVIHGQIIEVVPNEKISIELVGGIILVYYFDEIERIERQQVSSRQYSSQSIVRAPRSYYTKNPYRSHRWFGTWGLIGTWGLTVLGSAAMGDEMVETTVIPVVGPFITQARIEGENGEYLPGGKFLSTISGVTQSAFLVYTIVSAFMESNYNATHDVTVIPHLGDYAITLSIKF